MTEITLKITDSRRLTGPNLFWSHAGAILDVEVNDKHKSAVLLTWKKYCRTLLNALNWSAEKITIREYPKGASLVISAPIDCLYSATEITEAAWYLTEAEFGSQKLDLVEQINKLQQEISQERNPPLLALQQAAQQNKVKFLVDDEEVSLGYGKSCQVFSVNKLSKVNSIQWSEIKDIPVALVTGTNGKSTTVRLASSVIQAAGLRAGLTSTDYIRVGDQILDTGDYSGPGGARTLLRHPQTEVAVLEVARGGILRRGLGVNQATTVVVTNVAEDHLGEYGINSLEDMVEAKFTVRQALTKHQDLIVNADDEACVTFAKTLDNTLVWFSWFADNPVILQHLKSGGKACFVKDDKIVYQQGEHSEEIIAINAVPITLSGAAKHNVHNALAVTALCFAMGFEQQTIAQGLKNFTNTPENNPGRGNVFEFDGITVIVDFAHNEHGLSQMAQTLNNMPAKRRLVMMGQAGDRSDDLIRGLVKAALKAQPDALIVCEMLSHLRGREQGVVPTLIHQTALELGLQEQQILHASSTIDGAQKALDWAQPGDLLLLLGLTHRDEIIELLTRTSS